MGEVKPFTVGPELAVLKGGCAVACGCACAPVWAGAGTDWGSGEPQV